MTEELLQETKENFRHILIYIFLPVEENILYRKKRSKR